MNVKHFPVCNIKYYEGENELHSITTQEGVSEIVNDFRKCSTWSRLCVPQHQWFALLVASAYLLISIYCYSVRATQHSAHCPISLIQWRYLLLEINLLKIVESKIKHSEEKRRRKIVFGNVIFISPFCKWTIWTKCCLYLPLKRIANIRCTECRKKK